MSFKAPSAISHLLVALLLVGVTACSDSGKEADVEAPANGSPTTSPQPVESPSTKTEPSPRCEPSQLPASPDNDEVLVFFFCGGVPTPDAFRSFTRPVNPASTLGGRLDAAVSAYFAGPLQREGRRYYAFAGPKALNGTEVHGTRAIIDINLDGDFESTTSHQSSHIWNALRLLAFQFPSITEMEPRYNGSCAAFGQAVEAGECLIALRNGRYAPGP